MASIVVAVVLAGCGGGASEPVHRAADVCDGAEGDRDVSLVWRHIGGRLEPVDHVKYENGMPLLAVLESCEYFVYASGPDGDVHQLRRGRLSRGEAAHLAGELEAGRWYSALGARYTGDLIDGTTAELALDGEAVACGAGCEGRRVPAWLERVNDAAAAETRRLWRAGAPAGGALRISVVRISRGDREVDLAEWPLARPIDELAVDRREISLAGGFPRVENEAEADALRTLWRAYASGEHGAWYYRYLPFRRDGAEVGPPQYAVVIRDAFPFTDDRGLLRFDD